MTTIKMDNGDKYNNNWTELYIEMKSAYHVYFWKFARSSILFVKHQIAIQSAYPE